MDNGVTLQSQQMSFLTSVLRTTPIVYMCRNVIHHHLFGHGIEFAQHNGKIRPDPHMQEIMTDFWLPCCKQMVDSVLSYGFVVIRLVQLQHGLKVPVVIEPDGIRITMIYNLGIREYVVHDTQMNVIPETFVFDLFGHSPVMNGTFTSIVNNILPDIRYINTLRGTSLAMEQKRSNPIFITESVDTKNDNVEGVNYDFYADGDMQDNSSANKFNRDKHNVQALRHQQSLYDHFFTGGDPVSVGGDVLSNLVNIPLGQRLIITPTQTGRGDIVAQIKTFQDVVCGVMGIPKSLLMADTPHKSDEEGTHQTLKKTILSWKNNIQLVCEQIYSLIYADDIKKQLMKAIGKKRKKTRVQDVYALKKKLKVEIVFPIAPFLSHNELYIHYQRGVISWDTYTKHACAHASLPYEKLEEPSQTVESTEPTNVETDFDETEI